jgi:CheY-like chemotaxis protein
MFVLDRLSGIPHQADEPNEMAELSNELILLVDDDSTGRSVRKLVLEAHHHQVLAVGEAELALRTLQEQPIRLVILDYFLDGITGVELARKMRSLKPQVPILLLSGSPNTPEGIEHVDGYISKLAPVMLIEEKIAELLRRPGHL